MQTRIAKRIQSALLRGAFAVVLVWTFTGVAEAQKCDNKDCTIIGTSGHDILFGTPGDDIICGLGANDKILRSRWRR